MSKILNCACDLVCKAIESYIRKADDNLTEVLKKAGYIDPSYTVKQISELEDELTEILQGRTDEFIEFLEKHPRYTVQDAIDRLPRFNKKSNLEKALEAVFAVRFASAVAHLSNAHIKASDEELSVTQLTKRTTSKVKSWSKEVSALVNTTSETQFSSLLTRAKKKSLTISEVVEQAEERVKSNNATSARTTAVTEMLRMNNISAQESITQNPASKYKKWRHSGSRNIVARLNHIDMDNQLVRADKPFVLQGVKGGTHYPMYPMDPILPIEESIHCHCTLQNINDVDVLGLPLEEREKLQENAINLDNEKWKKEQKELSKRNAKERSKLYRQRRKNKENSTDKSSNSLDNSGKSGIIGEKSKKPITKITDKAISKVKKVEINGLTDKQAEYVQQQHKELLEYARDNNENKEVAFVFTENFKKRYDFKGTDDSLDFGSTLIGKGDNLFVMHNHPRNSSYSLTDLILFRDYEQVKTLTIVKNNGSMEYITKSKEFNSLKFKIEYDRLYHKTVINNTDSEKDKFVKKLLNKTKSGVIWSEKK